MAEPLNPALRRRHRYREAKSCEPCRTRKIKCDRGLPCRPCLRSRASLPCTYKSDHVQSGSLPQKPPQLEFILDDDVLANGSDETQVGDVSLPREPPSVTTVGDETTSSLSRRLGVLEQLYQRPGHGNSQNSSLKEIEARLSRVEQHIESSRVSRPNLSDKSELRIRLPHPHLRAEHEKTRLFGKTHWVHSLEQFHILSQMQSKPYSVVDGAQGLYNKPMLEAACARRRAKNQGAKLLQEPMPGLRESIPARGICDQALDGYLRTFEPMFRILHVPSFMRQYESYWTDPRLAQTEFLMKLTMVITIGGIFLADRSIAKDIKRTARNWAYAVQWWLTGPTERDAMSIDGIQVFCLLLLARQTSSLGGTACIITEALSKLSFTLGLHIDPRVHASVTSFESELRRRLWLTVLELATINSLNSTLPLLLYAGDYAVPLPSNVADSCLQEDQGSGTNQGSVGHEAIDCSVQILLAKSLRLRMQIVRELNDTSREVSYERVNSVSNSLQTHCRELTAFFHPEEPKQQERPITRGFQEKFLDTYFRRLILFLHRPFAHQARHNARYLPSRKICLDASLIMATHTEDMDLGSSTGQTPDDFSRCCIAGSGMFKGALGQDVILAISLEIITELEDEERGNRDNPGVTTSSLTDPLALLARKQREPLMRYLRHVREQWKHVILLGRPSLKQYLFLSCILAQIEAMEAEQDARGMILETIRGKLHECASLLRDTPAYADADDDVGEGEVAWADDTSPDTIDTMTLFGFDFSALDSSFAMDMPFWTEASSTTDIQGLAGSAPQ